MGPQGPSAAVRPVRPEEYAEVAALVVRAYSSGGVITDDDDYRATLADTAGRAARAEVYVLPDASGALVATVTLSPYGSTFAQVSRPAELEFRMLAVDPAAAGRGLGSALVGFCAASARARGDEALVLCVIESNAVAIRMYERLGFVAQPDRDRLVPPGVRLRVFRLELAGSTL